MFSCGNSSLVPITYIIIIIIIIIVIIIITIIIIIFVCEKKKKKKKRKLRGASNEGSQLRLFWKNKKKLLIHLS